MSKKLSLAILGGKKIIEVAVIAWSEKCWKRIIPRRQPDRAKEKEAAWIIGPEKRRVFGKHATRMLEQFNAENMRNHKEEELYGFFAIVGIGSRWVDNTGIRWCLYLGERELKPGKVL